MTNERKTNGSGAGSTRARKNTPIISVGGPDGAADRLVQLQRHLRRTLDLCEQVERLVRAGGFTVGARANLSELADHFENDLPMISAGTGRILRRLADLG